MMIMSRRRPIMAAALLVLGVSALVFLPGRPASQISEANATDVAETPMPKSAVSPSPALLETLERAVSSTPEATAAEADTRGPAPSMEPQPNLVASASPILAQPVLDGASASAPANANFHPATVGAMAVNIRADASSGAPRIGVLQAGQSIQAGDTVNGWTAVALPDGSTGWVYSSFLAGAEHTVKAAEGATARPAPSAPRSALAVVRGGDGGSLSGRIAHIGSRIPAKAGPSGAAQTILILSPGDDVRIAEERAGWLRVVTSEGVSVWIQRSS